MKKDLERECRGLAEADEGVASMYEAWVDYQEELDKKSFIGSDENYELERLYKAYEEALEEQKNELISKFYNERRKPIFQEGWYYLFGEDGGGDWTCFLAAQQKHYLRKFSEQLEGSDWEIWADGHKCEWD